MDAPIRWEIRAGNTGPMEVSMDFIDPRNEVIDLLQYALMYGITVDWVPGIQAFVPLNVDIRSNYVDTYGGKVHISREVRVDGTLAP